MHVYGDMDHDREADLVDAFFYSGLWNARGGGCEIFHDRIMYDDVAVPGKSVHISVPGDGIWPDGSVDRDVRGLDRQGRNIYGSLLQRKMAGAPCNSVKRLFIQKLTAILYKGFAKTPNI